MCYSLMYLKTIVNSELGSAKLTANKTSQLEPRTIAVLGVIYRLFKSIYGAVNAGLKRF